MFTCASCDEHQRRLGEANNRVQSLEQKVAELEEELGAQVGLVDDVLTEHNLRQQQLALHAADRIVKEERKSQKWRTRAEKKRDEVLVTKMASVDCPVCMDEPRKIVLFPCAHFCLCSTCYDQLSNSGQISCPLCQSPVYAATRVYS
mmetsp:Transcript_14760/g.46321  ORF Transcript_14760/g.46321 Transcript_14760/m.46321 type:complete len:147 (-) Transcript_14760:37-477(-)